MPIRRIALVAALALTAAVPPVHGSPATTCGGPVIITENANALRMDNGCAARTWLGGSGGPASFIEDMRAGTVSLTQPDFSLVLDGARISSNHLLLASRTEDGNGTARARITWRLLLPGLAEITRVVEGFAGIAGWKSQTTISSLAPLALSGYTLDEVAVGSEARATIHAFRAGADWRTPSWNPPSVGDPHRGDWRATTTGGPGEAVGGAAQWISAAQPSRATVAMIAERHDYASSVASYSGAPNRNVSPALADAGTMSIGVDFSRDIVYLGPFEEGAHAENPGPGPARHRAVIPGRPLPLEPAYTVLGADADDEPWQAFQILSRARFTDSYHKAVIFNSDGVDTNKISTGAKDDMDFARFLQIMPAIRRMGFDLFVFDDGWQANSGDWCADAATCPEARTPRFPHRFPDDHFAAVQEVLRGDPHDPTDDIALGLWMTPMEFHPASRAFKTNPQWACAPVGHGTAAVSIVQPDSSSNEAGIGVWNPMAWGVHPDTGEPMRLIDYIEGRILRAIEVFGARFFKFDFLVWIDCGGAEPVTMYEYHDAFVQMVDRVQAKHPEVIIEIDDTNDYRMFPFETIARGPSWFANGSPTVAQQLHNVWHLSPFVPGFAIGQRALKNTADRKAVGIDTAMAAALTSHLTLSQQVDNDYTVAEQERIGAWSAFYKANRDTLATFSYPLLDDPLAGGWTALQPRAADGSGWVVAFRQKAASDTIRIPLRGLGLLPPDTRFTLYRVFAPDGVRIDAGTFTAEQLRTEGMLLTIPEIDGSAFVEIVRA